jgi:hypothetical protein
VGDSGGWVGGASDQCGHSEEPIGHWVSALTRPCLLTVQQQWDIPHAAQAEPPLCLRGCSAPFPCLCVDAAISTFYEQASLLSLAMLGSRAPPLFTAGCDKSF